MMMPHLVLRFRPRSVLARRVPRRCVPRRCVPGALAFPLAALLLAPTATAAGPADGSGVEGADRQTASLRLTETRPNRPSGLRLRIDYVNPADRAQKPPAVRRVTEILARGSRIDTGAVPLCAATDAELILLGAAACPRASVVGTGVIVLDTGLAGPARFLTEDVTFLNNTDQLIFLTKDRLTGAPFVIRARVTGRRLISKSPFLPGTPPDGAAVDTVLANFPKAVSERNGVRRSYVTTPSRCPSRGFWVNRLAFTYADGATQTLRNRSRCHR